MIHNFANLINKYAAKDVLLVPLLDENAEGSWVDGEWVEPEKAEPVPLHCAIVPMRDKQIYDSGGRYTSSDRQVYTHTKLQTKQQIVYRKVTYSVEEEADHTEYGDFFIYTARRVNPNA